MRSQRAPQQPVESGQPAEADDDLLLSAVREAGLGAWRWQIRTGEVEWSSQTYHIFGLARGSAVASYQGFIDRVHPADRALVAARIGHAAETGGGNFIEFRIQRLDGSVRSATFVSQVLAGDDGKPAVMVGLICDVTDRKDTPGLRGQDLKAEEATPAFSTREVATLLGVAEASVKRLADANQLPCLRSETRGVRRFAPQHLLGFLRTQTEARAPTPNTAAAKVFGAAAARNDLAGAVAVALELYGAGAGLETTLDALVTPAAEGAAPGFVESFLERVVPLGSHQKRTGAPAVVISIGHPAPLGPALITCLLRSRGYETLKLVQGLDPQQAGQAAVRSGARLIVLVFAGVLAADETEKAALVVAGRLAAALPPQSVCAFGPRLRSLPPGVVSIRTMQDLAQLMEAAR